MIIHTEQAKPRTDEAILAAALELFSQRGFHGTAVPAIARRAGIAAGTIYRHFASKEELVNVLYRRCKVALMTTLFEGFDLSAPPGDQFRSLWFRIAEFAREHPMAFEFLEHHHHQAYLDEESMALERASLVPFLERIQDDEVRAALEPLPAEALMAFVWGSFSALFKAHRLGHLELRDELVAKAQKCCWDAIRRID